MGKRLTNAQKIDALHSEATEWAEGSDQNGSLEFALRNGFDLHAVALWQSSGASALKFSAKIDRKKELAEIKALCASADIFICKHCNNHSFFDAGEIETDETPCESCLKTMHLDRRASK